MRLLAILPVKPRAAKANSSSRISYQKLAPWQDNAFWQEGCCLGQQPSVQYANRLGASIDDRVTKAKKMLPVRLMHASARRGLRALAALVLVLFLSLLALASLPALHQAIRRDNALENIELTTARSPFCRRAKSTPLLLMPRFVSLSLAATPPRCSVILFPARR